MWTNATLPPIDRLKAVLRATFGGTSGGLSVLGAVHGVCHATSQGLVAAAAFAGISLIGMPLAFLLDPRWTLGFAAMGIASASGGLYMRLRAQQKLSKGVLRFGLVGLISLLTLSSSLWQMAAAQRQTPSDLAAATVAPPRLELDAAEKSAQVGGVSAQAEYLGIVGGALRFRIALNSNDMAAPPFDPGGVGSTAYLAISERRLGASKWTVQDTGHMGHHPRAVVEFQLDAALASALAKAKQLELGFASDRGRPYHRFNWPLRQD